MSEADRQVFAHIVGFIAARLVDGTYKQIPPIGLPTAGDVGALGRMWRSYVSHNRGHVYTLLSRRRNASRDLNGLKGTVQHLIEHTRDTQQYLGTVSELSLRTLIPDLSTSVAGILRNPPYKPMGNLDATVLALCRWFKDNFMSWVDPVLCPQCNGPTQSAGNAAPSAQESTKGAGRVELHRCADGACGATRRFPRYGTVAALVESREGRCGEWAHLFYAMMRVKGIEGRYIWNSEDHVWCEYWSPIMNHWVHVDPCEAATNKPLTYAKGWGKKQAYCLAFGPYGAEDVTRAYVDDWDGDCQVRRQARGWSERDLQVELLKVTVSLRLRMDPVLRARLYRMDESQRSWISDENTRLKEAESMGFEGRISGPDEWKRMRDELGDAKRAVVKPRYTVATQFGAQVGDLVRFGDVQTDSDSKIVLTSAKSQTSAVFQPCPIPQTQNFSTNMTFRMTPPPEAGGADGIAILFAKNQSMGLGGYGLGYSGAGDEGDFAVEVDTYRTQDFADDPPTPHISVHSPPNAHHRHSIACTRPGDLPQLSNGEEYTLHLIYSGNTRRLRGYLTVPPSDGGEEIELVDVVIPKGRTRTDWYAGVTGSCGGLWQRQEVTKWSIDLIEFEEGDVVREEADDV
ncbi:hypothetical protein L202_05402 [Cryptococcus amylolentus CBS 6039]|uniref:Transglutaminase-like domain-containing protein n=1 Tax=Cryptococcus amylolentus CBS 6039 TaxID=1295533 RepID=A0A1E3HKE5_9TREE|nr:hypothetical protein L202_05402 [Cryptococcus amylolentus CBS 6039]ODN76800.1 hypothetical protein L202_05402 [Cryptococcus amylolentus CBS 6039]